MTSSVFFKFKSQKEPSRVEFDGTGISVFELKRDIITKSGLGDGTEFDLVIYNEDGNEEYDDDTTIIPRSTTVIARRLPPQKAGAGRAARYVSGKMPVNAKNSSRKEVAQSKSSAKPMITTNSASAMSTAVTEEDRMAAMFQAQSEQWSAQQDELANQTPVFNGRPGGNKKGGPPPNVPDHEPPTGYICYRCGEKGHWIQVCPTNDDPNFDNKPRVKRTTGIPRSFLKTVEKPVALAGDGTTEDVKAPQGVMVNAEGEFVIAEPDKASWEQFQAKTKSSAAAQKTAASGDKELQDRGLECSIDKRMFIDPMKTPCCEKTYCNDCITNALIESDFICPGCQTDEVFIDNLTPDVEMSTRIEAYLAERNAAKQEKERSKSPSVKAEAVATPSAEFTSVKTDTKVKAEHVETPKSPSPKAKSPTAEVKSPKSPSNVTGKTSPTASAGSPITSKKRPADELLENPKIPKGPRAMQQQEAQKQSQSQQPQMMNSFNAMAGFPMPFDMSSQQFPMNNFMNGMNGMGMMNGYNMSMPPTMGMGNAMMNPIMGMNPFPMSGGFPNMNAMGMGGGMYNNSMGFAGNMGNNGGSSVGMASGGAGIGMPSGFPNQQKTVFAAPLPNEEDNAYFRKPVNPHRHQGRQRRARPSDYREL